MGADSAEELRVAEGEMQRAVASHGDARDGAVGAAGGDAIALFDEREKFLQKKIFVAVLAVLGIDVEARTTVGRGDQEVLQFTFFALVFDEIPEAGMDEELFVVAESVEGIEDRKVFCFVGVESWRKDDAVRDAAGEDFAGEGVALDAAGGGGKREVKEV